MASVEKTIEVNVPVRTAYNQWTQLEAFPRFMEGVEKVRPLDGKHLRWRVSITGKEESWNAEITEQVPDQKVAWRSTSGAENWGQVQFTPVGTDRARVKAVIGYQPEGVVENVGEKLGAVDRRVEGDLERFKSFSEGRGVETGAWRGEIHGSAVEGEASVQ